MDTVNLQDGLNKVMSWKREGLNIEQIAERLLQSGIPESMKEEVILKWKEIRNEKKRNNAFIYCGIGIGLLTTGFLFTLFLFDSGGSYSFGLYGLTIIGLILVFKGMIDLMS
jgi:hypothetical protein